MKNISTILLLALLLVSVESFVLKPAAEKQAGYDFTVDGAGFEAKSSNSYAAQLTNSGRTASITLLGNEVTDKQGRSHPSRIQIDYTFKDGILGEVNVESATYEYNNQKYNLLPGTAYMSITKMKWGADHKSFTLCADVFCKVQKPYIIEENVPVFVVRGQLQNMVVNAPAM